MPILSVQFARDMFKRLNLEAVDPSDAMRNFRHVMDFKKTKGFAPIAPLEPAAGDPPSKHDRRDQ
ncbi:MAG: hypothetical protein ACOZAA_01580 [Pseudomonadota bacterium]